ncbi:pirin family protein [Candidatus Gracilibacteria bacterium]|nr:pirin family protein [Candidatus Gracilibacteria bacterium]
MSYQIIKKEDRFFSSMGNMSSYFLFNFAEYFDPNNEKFGNLRVFNDDYLEPNSGFPLHPHKYYEILTLVLEGTITHKDSLGNEVEIKENEIQVTNTATGIFHSEFNHSNNDLKLYQIWFAPDEMAKTPIYYTSKYQKKDLENKLFVIASGIGDSKNKLSSKVELSRGVFEGGEQIGFNLGENIFLYIRYGKIKLSTGETLINNDQLRIIGDKIDIEFLEKSDIVVIKTL